MWRPARVFGVPGVRVHSESVFVVISTTRARIQARLDCSTFSAPWSCSWNLLHAFRICTYQRRVSGRRLTLVPLASAKCRLKKTSPNFTVIVGKVGLGRREPW